MKKILLSFAVIIFFSTGLYAVQVTFYMGKATVIRHGKKIRVRTGLEIKSGDVIKTGDKGLVELVYKDKSRVIIREKSTVRIGSRSIDDSESPALILGSLTSKFKKIQKGTHKVYTPTAICAVRGTEYDVAVSSGGDTRVSVKEGGVDVSNPEGSVELKKGNDAVAEVSGKPQKEKREKLSQWLQNKDKEFAKDPKKGAKKFDKHVGILNAEALSNEKFVEKLDAVFTEISNRDTLELTGKEIQKVKDMIEDDIMMTESVSEAIGIIAENFKKRKIDIYREFEKIKKDSNKVLEIQKISYQDIEEVINNYMKAHDMLMGDFSKDANELFFNESDLDEAKPDIEKYDLK